MDMIELRRRVMLSMGVNNAKCVEGQFIGNGTNTVELSIPFAPDVIIVDSDLDVQVSGWVGIAKIIIVKRMMSVNSRHTNVSTTGNASNVNIITSDESDYGDKDHGADYASIANYSNGILTLTNCTVARGVSFVDGQTYTWKVYAKT